MTENLDMGGHTITGIRSSSADNAALRVGASKSLYLPISGIRGMQGDLNMGKLFTIINIKPFVENESEVINFGYFSNQRVLLKTLINKIGCDSLSSVDASDKMEIDLNMNIHYIKRSSNIKFTICSHC